MHYVNCDFSAKPENDSDRSSRYPTLITLPTAEVSKQEEVLAVAPMIVAAAVMAVLPLMMLVTMMITMIMTMTMMCTCPSGEVSQPISIGEISFALAGCPMGCLCAIICT